MLVNSPKVWMATVSLGMHSHSSGFPKTSIMRCSYWNQLPTSNPLVADNPMPYRHIIVDHSGVPSNVFWYTSPMFSWVTWYSLSKRIGCEWPLEISVFRSQCQTLSSPYWSMSGCRFCNLFVIGCFLLKSLISVLNSTPEMYIKSWGDPFRQMQKRGI